MKKKIFISIIVILVILICLANIICPFAGGKMKKLVDENGNVIEGSISEKIWLDTDGTKLGLIIKSENPNNPVLLVLGGGPGIPEYLLEDIYDSHLYKYFTVCYINYRGTGLSYDKNINKESLTSEKYFEDAITVTNYLRGRFNKEKIYLVGHSFGTYISLNVVQKNPELYEGYIAMSMCVDQKKSEKVAYDYMMEQYEKSGKTKKVKELEKYSSIFENIEKIDLQDKLTQDYFRSARDKDMHELGIGTTHEMKSVISGIFLPSFKMQEFTVGERINIWKAKKATENCPVIIDSFNFNAFETIKKIEVPIYVFAGVYDYTTEYSLQKEYFEMLEAPKKKFYTFKNSAHSPLFEENEKAINIIKSDIL